MNFNLSFCSNPAVGFDSTVDNSEKKVMVRDASTITEKSTQKRENVTQSIEMKNNSVSWKFQLEIDFPLKDENSIIIIFFNNRLKQSLQSDLRLATIRSLQSESFSISDSVVYEGALFPFYFLGGSRKFTQLWPQN